MLLPICYLLDNIHSSNQTTHKCKTVPQVLDSQLFKNSVKMQQCSAKTLAQRRAESLQGVGNPEA